MTREERLAQLAKEYYRLDKKEKEWKARREELRDELFRLIDYDYRGKDHLLPVITIEVPDSFFQTTGMTKEEFSASRFPGWIIEHCERNTSTGITTFVLKKNSNFVPRVVEAGSFHFSKSISESTPEVDWDTLEKERPDLHDMLVRRVEVKELNDDALEELVNAQPEELATLQRHMKVKPPVLRAVPKKVKNGRERLI